MPFEACAPQVSAVATRTSPYVPPELLSKIFLYVVHSSAPLTQYTSTSPYHVAKSSLARQTLHSACLVSKSWYFPAVEALWHEPLFLRIEEFVLFMKALQWIGSGANAQHTVDADRKGKGRATDTANKRDGKALKRSIQHNLLGTTGPPSIRHLSLSTFPFLPPFITPNHLQLLCTYPPTITHLSLANCRTLTDASLVSLLTHLAPRLISLDITNCWRATDLTLQVIAFFAGPWRRLKRVIVRGCGFISDAGLVRLGQECGAGLEVLDVTGCWRVSDAGMVRFLGACQKALKRETKLRMGGNVGPEDEEGDDEDVASTQSGVVATCGKLKEVRFSACRKFTRNGACTLFKTLSHRNHYITTKI